MKLSIKKVVGALLTVPILALSVVVFGAVPANAAGSCPNPITNNYTSPKDGCTTVGGGTQWWYNGTNVGSADGWKTANDEACQPNSMSDGINCAQGNDQPSNLFGNGGIVTTVINVLLLIVGILCVVMIIFGGIRYTTSAGDKGRIDGAKSTLIYAIVGLVVAIVAYALVNWVFGAVTGS
jgi:hypothetical protein